MNAPVYSCAHAAICYTEDIQQFVHTFFCVTPRLTSDLGPHLAGVNANIDCGTVDLLTRYPLNVNHPLLSVNGNHLALSALHLAVQIHELMQPCAAWKLCPVVVHCSASSCKCQFMQAADSSYGSNTSCLLPPLV